MKRASVLYVSSFLLCSYVGAETVRVGSTKEIICECIGTYTRIGFVVKDKSLTNLRVIDGSSSELCDKWHIDRVQTSITADHPDGVTGTGVAGYFVKDKSIDRKTCLKKDELELDSYWFVEKISIDLKKISRQ